MPGRSGRCASAEVSAQPIPAPLQTFAEPCLSLNVATTPCASRPALSFGAAAHDEFGGEGEVDRSGVTVSEQVE